MMIERNIRSAVEASLRAFPAVGLVGPRQVGKTTLARAIAAEWPSPVLSLDLESPDDVARIANAELFLSEHEDHLVVVDEAQAKPDLFPVLRVMIDRNRRPGRFLILGSATPTLKRQASESLAGRIAYHELTPFTLEEISENGHERESASRLWIRGGYPDSFLAKSEALSARWRENFVTTHLERDMPVLGIRIPATTLRRFWTMIAHCHGQTWNASRIGESMAVDHKTARRYLDALGDTYMLRQLQPYFANVKKQLVKSPKVYVRDSGLLHTLLRIDTLDTLRAHPVGGSSSEGFCIEQILASIPDNWTAGFYRTRSGAEMDLVLEPVQMTAPIAIEIKSSAAPKLTRGNWSAINDLSPRMTYVVYPGTESFSIDGKVRAIPPNEIPAIAAAADN